MGDRGQVQIKSNFQNDGDIWLYTHWDGHDLVETVRVAMAKKWRWNDPEYLTRIIFCEMVKGEESGETGYGIGTFEHGDIWIKVVVDMSRQVVEVFEQELEGWRRKTKQTFLEFIKG